MDVARRYNRSIPGQLRNILDWSSRPYPVSALHGKAVAIIRLVAEDAQRGPAGVAA